MLHRVLASILCVCLALSVAPRAGYAQHSEIKDTIRAQIEALKVDDFETAFSYAHPSIQGMFSTPQNFGRMVAQGYPMVWRPAAVEYLRLREEEGRLFQDVRVTDANGEVFVLEYAMREVADGWRIAGVRILAQDAMSV